NHLMREQNDRIRKLEHIAHIGSWELNLTTNELMWSEEFYHICGLDRDTQPDFDLMIGLIHPDDLEEALKVVDKVVNTGEPYFIQKRIIRSDGQVRWLEARGEVVLDGQTQQSKLMGIFSDITHRKESEIARERSEARATALLNAIPDLVFRFHKNGTYLDFHGDASQLIDSDPHVLGKTVTERLGAELGQLFQDTIHQTLQTGTIQYIEYEISANNEKRIIEARFVQSNLDEVTAVMRDVTVERYREREIINNEMQYQSLLAAMVEGVILQGADREVIMCNEAACEILGTTREQLLAPVAEHPNWNFVDIDGNLLTSETYPTRITRTTGEPQSNIVIGFIHPQTSNMRWIKLNVRAIFDQETQQVDKTVLTFEDITDERQAEQDRLNAALERERINLLNSFIQMASHEFRTPLSVILTNLHLLSRLSDESKRQEKIERIKLQIQRLDHLIAMQLLMTKLDTGIQLRLKPHNIDVTVSQVIMLFDSELSKKQIRFDTILQDNLQAISIDSEYFSEALSQIIKNAVAHTPIGGIITLDVRQVSNNTLITIRDTGVGLSEDDLPFVFDRFWRKDKAHTDAGFGLGLALAKQVLALHGGSITLLSALNEGTTVTMILPFTSQDA
ncbi:MAG: ATP-binding protein, partial [Phototrophicaceae bacterium]